MSPGFNCLFQSHPFSVCVFGCFQKFKQVTGVWIFYYLSFLRHIRKFSSLTVTCQLCKKIMKDKEKLINESFEISEDIRYIAVYDNDGLSMKQRSDINNVSSNES